ncbi:MAG TPA: DNA polymerase III subunit beta, partial [Candidatus Latescibacteria bacterium]|nr:DNA polymerase III subunit beta [Candidatus Latescibacterota bacterium]
LAATNLDIGIQYWLGAKVEKPGQLVVPAKEVSEFVSYLGAEKLTLAAEGKLKLKITSRSGETVFNGMDPAEFPQIPAVNQEKTVSLSTAELSQAVNQVGFAAASDDSRPVLTAIYWQFTSTGYQMVATDGYRLSQKTVAVKGVKLTDKEEAVFLVPARSLIELVRLAAEEKEFRFGLTDDQNQVVFLLPSLQLNSRLIEGEFPDYQKIIPQQAKVKVMVDREAFYRAVKISSVFARESANIVKLKLEKEKIIISANAPSVGENKTEVEAKIEGQDLTIAFNYRFLLDFLNVIPEKEG